MNESLDVPATHSVRTSTYALACLLALVAVVLAGCSAEPVVDEGSPRCTGASIDAGSELSEASQFVEVRLTFDAELQAAGDPAGDFAIELNGKAPDEKTVAVSANTEGSDVVVRLHPTDAAASGGSTYFALYDGKLSIASSRADGALAHVHAAGATSAAVFEEPRQFVVPSGVQIALRSDTGADLSAEGVAGGESPDSANSSDAGGKTGEVSFDVTSFAKLRCCTWLRFSGQLPTVRLHSHQFYRDTEKTCAQRLSDTLNATYGQWFSASCDGARVTVRSLDSSIPLSAEIVEGEGADPGDDGGVGAWEEA